MKKDTKHSIGRFLLIAGFVTVAFGGIVSMVILKNPGIGIAAVAGGFIMFLLGAEMVIESEQHIR